MSLVVSALNLYPVKSLGGIALLTADVRIRGFRRDRQWMVVNEERKHVTQREVRRMALVRVTEETDGGIKLDAPGMSPLFVTDETCREPAKVTVWRDTVDALLAGGDTATWLTEYLGLRADLAFLPPHLVRPVNPNYGAAGDEVAFADGYPILVATDSSLQDLNARMETPLPMNRFRPNIVLSGSLPWDEDNWRALRFPALRLRVVKPCDRCVVTTVDQTTGVSGLEPLRTLATFRKIGRDVFFGQNAIPDGEGRIAVGDVVVAE